MMELPPDDREQSDFSLLLQAFRTSTVRGITKAHRLGAADCRHRTSAASGDCIQCGFQAGMENASMGSCCFLL
jgi:hypothetical protein